MKNVIHILFIAIFVVQWNAMAACTGTTTTWAGTDSTWSTDGNWDTGSAPDTSGEDVVIVNNGTAVTIDVNNTNVGCVDVNSGTFNCTSNRDLIIHGDYFQAADNTLNFTNNGCELEFAGTSAQYIDVQDDIRDIRINNTAGVTLKNTFRVRNDFFIDSSGTTTIEGDITLQSNSKLLTIPAGHTMLIKNGASLFARGGVTIEGTLEVEPGGELRIYRDRTVTVASGGTLKLLGASGNPAKLISEASNRTFNLNLDGTLTADYFLIQKPTAAGLNVSSTGVITQLDNGEFRGVADTGYLITLQAGATVPSTADAVGFYNDDSVASPGNVDASLYNGTTITFSNYAGDIAGDTYESDTNAKVDWSAAAATELTVVNSAETGEPGNFYDPGDEMTFGEYQFALTQSDTATNITSITFTMTGTGSMSDFEWVRAIEDTNGNCERNGSDAQIGSDLTFTGTPPKATVTIPSGDLTTDGPSNPGCIFIRAKAATNPVDGNSLKFEISLESDVTNSESYAFSATSGLPVSSNQTVVRNPNFSTWDGTTDTLWSDTNNWNGGLPSSTRDCTIGSGSNTAEVNTTPVSCANATLQSGGEINWNSTSNEFQVYGSLDVAASYTFTTATSGKITMAGTSNQTLSVLTAFPGNLDINNTGTAPNNVVTVSGSSTINGNLTCVEGELSIPNTATLRVLGDITIQSGCELNVGEGGTLELGDGATLTVDTGGTLTLIGTSGTNATVTSDLITSSYEVVVNGTISARYYTFSNLGTNGVSIESGATISNIYHLGYGSFIYPVNNNTTFLKLKTQVPHDFMDSANFDSNGSVATSITNIDTTGAASGTLSIQTYSGDLAGTSNDIDPSYNISWVGAATELLLTAETSNPTTVTTGNIYNMGRFGLQQKDAGASYNDTEVTSVKLTLIGTGNSGDIEEVKLHWDQNCDDSSDQLIGLGTFTGNPASITFAPSSGTVIVPADVSSPDKVCLYVEYEIASDATDGSTVGVQIAANTDIVDDESYGISSTTPAPVATGSGSTIDAPTTTTWDGSTDTNWSEPSNWSAGVPDQNTSCEIPNLANDPTISTGTAVCKDVNITSGVVTISGGATLEFYGNFSNSGTLNQTGDLQVSDGGSALNHNISSDTDFGTLIINKTGTGYIDFTSTTLSIDTITINNNSFVMRVPSGKTLTLPNGINLTGGELKVQDSGTLEIGNGQTLTVSGGTFSTGGSNDSFPQNLNSKGVITAEGGGSNTWSFSATSGTVNLVGFNLDRLDNNGLNISGTTNVTAIDGGQLTNLSTSYASMYGIQLNTTGSLPSSMTNVAWVWGAFNSFDPANTDTPTESDGYTLVRSTGCGSQTVDFTGWTGDFYESQTTFDTSTKVSASSCTINLAASASAVSLLSFEATGYNGEVDIKWETNVENDHLGFNIYRSDEDANNFIQLNSEIIRNLNNYASRRGKYQFIDSDVENGTTYYYYIEDIDTSGTPTLHGPKYATPNSSAGSATVESDHNQAAKSNNADDGGGSSGTTINNPSYQDLGDGVVIHSQTSEVIRLEITPSTPSFATSSWDSDYDTVSIEGYSKLSNSTYPELPVRTLLIDVYPLASTASILSQTLTPSTLSSYKIAPAATYTQNGSGGLDASYSIDATTYSTNGYYIDDHIEVESNLVSSGDKKYLKVTIYPLRHNPVAEDLIFSNSILLDIALDGNDWGVEAPEDNQSFTNAANILRVDFTSTGVYELTYDEIDETNQIEPFKDQTLSDFRLYFNDQESAIEVEDADSDGLFSSGDKLRFYLEHTPSLEDSKNRAFLSPIALKDESSSALRITDFDGDPTGEDAAAEGYYYQEKTYEENWEFIDGISLRDNDDHFMWSSLISYSGLDALTISTTLEGINSDSDENVQITVHLAAVEGYLGNHFDHHLELYIDTVFEDDVVFSGQGRTTVTFDVPADRFASTAAVKLLIPGTYSVNSDYDRVMIDKVVFNYTGYSSSGNVKIVTLDETMVTHTFTNFGSSSISAYDVTSPYEPTKIINGSVTTPDSGTTYDIEFYVDDDVNSTGNKKVAVFEDSSFYNPSNISLNPGGRVSLKLSTNRADLIIIGAEDLLAAITPLKEQREAQGLDVITVTPDQIYNEFSNGIKSTEGIRQFVSYALDYWVDKPEYILILGDGTIDPLDHDVDGLDAEERSATYESTIPAPLIEGRFLEFSGDNFFVTNGTTSTPRVAIGRIPTNSPDLITIYVNKVIDFESGTTAPDNLKANIFLSGEELDDYDQFIEKTTSLADIPLTYPTRAFTSSIYDYYDYANAAAYKTEIIDIFNNDTPLFLNYIGHGANDRWGSSTFLISDIASLTNTKLPIVLTWNCEAAYYMDYSTTYQSLGENLILAEDKGAIAFLGSTAQTTPSAQMTLAENFYRSIATNTNSHYQGQRLGDLLQEAKLSTGSNAYESDIVNSFTILGDPSLKLPTSIFAPDPVSVTRSSGSGGASDSGGGCSAFASEDSIYADSHWAFGLMEWVFYLLFTVFIVFIKNRVYTIISMKKD